MVGVVLKDRLWIGASVAAGYSVVSDSWRKAVDDARHSVTRRTAAGACMQITGKIMGTTQKNQLSGPYAGARLS